MNRILTFRLVRVRRNSGLIKKESSEGSTDLLANIEKPTRILQTKNERTIMTASGSFVQKNRVSPYAKRQFIFFTFLVYLAFLYIVYLAYNGTLVHRVKINMAPFQLFGNVHGAQQATHYSEIYTKICGLEKPVDLDGLSALHWAAIHDNVESAKLIRKFQEPGEVEYDEFAKKYAVDINVRQIRLPEIFYLVFWPFMLKEKYLDQTLGHKVGYLQEFSGYTPLHCAAWCGSLKMLEWLLDQPDIDSKATDDHGHDVFGMAVKQNNFRAAQILIERNKDFDINQRSKQGYTLLHEAAADGNLSAIKFLVKNGADLALHGPCGQTAAGWCEERHYKLRRDEMPNSKYLLCLKYLEEKMEEKGLLPAFDV